MPNPPPYPDRGKHHPDLRQLSKTGPTAAPEPTATPTVTQLEMKRVYEEKNQVRKHRIRLENLN